MRKTRNGVAWLTMLIFLLTPVWVLARNETPLPFAPIDTKVPTVSMVQERYAYMKNLNKNNPNRIEFFRLSSQETGYMEPELDIIIRRQGFVIKSCGNCRLYTFGMNREPVGTSTMWRTVTPTEPVVFITAGEGKLVPWFLPRCMNPVEEEKVALKPPEPPAVIGCVYECWQSGPTMISYPFAGLGNNIFVGNGNLSISSGGVFSGIVFHTPITCGTQPIQQQ